MCNFAFVNHYKYKCNFMVNRINTILQAKNITAKQFAEEIGVQPSGVSHILSGRNNPSLDFVMKVVRRYPEININWLMFGNGEMWVGNVVPSVAQTVEVAPTISDVVVSNSEIKNGSVQSAFAATNDTKVGSDGFGEGADADGVGASKQNVINNSLEGAVGVSGGGAAVRGGISDSKAVHDNLTLFDDAEPNLFNVRNEKQDLEHSRVTEPVFNYDRVRVMEGEVKPRSEEMGVSNSDGKGKTQLNENRSNDSVRPSASENAILAKPGRRIMKIVVLYDDYSFSEFSPER